jgi:4-deoxy-L-threo-5-hexosulose-uronate ketol-isomerase
MKQIVYSQAPSAVKGMTNEVLRSSFTLGELFADGEIRLQYWETDRTVVGGAVPLKSALDLPVPEFVGEASFLARREMGVLNLGGAGSVVVDGETHSLAQFDGLYLGRGVEKVQFQSKDSADPARFYLLSYPAHTTHPTTKIARESVDPLELGTPEGANERKLYKVIHPGTCATCQLVMGYTRILPGSVWNTMPPHTHIRRSEVYLYFDMADDALVVHLMGRPSDTRSVIMRNFEAVLSPAWSIHCGAGTGSYSFVWGMGGENQDFTDMQGFSMGDLL